MKNDLTEFQKQVMLIVEFNSNERGLSKAELTLCLFANDVGWDTYKTAQVINNDKIGLAKHPALQFAEWLVDKQIQSSKSKKDLSTQ